MKTIVNKELETDKQISFTLDKLQKRGKNSIFLSGFMGAGKTTVGKLLADKLGMRFFDTDGEIEKELCMPVPEMFEKMGESYFRVVEHSFVDKFSRMQNVVVSLGGGAMLTAKNYFTAERNALVIYLEADEETLVERLRNQAENRPLLKGEDVEKRVHQLLLLRTPLYRKNCDIKVLVGKTAEETLENILNAI